MPVAHQEIMGKFTSLHVDVKHFVTTQWFSVRQSTRNTCTELDFYFIKQLSLDINILKTSEQTLAHRQFLVRVYRNCWRPNTSVTNMRTTCYVDR